MDLDNLEVQSQYLDHADLVPHILKLNIIQHIILEMELKESF